MHARVMVAEDDAKAAELMRLYFERDGYAVAVVHNGRDAIDEARRRRPDLVILDLMLPGVDGLDVCRVLRAESAVPIIVVTARTAEADTLLALDLGADDYLTKPVRPRELVARARAVLRRAGALPGESEETLRFPDLEIDMRRHEVRRGGERVHITPREFQILATLAREPGKVFTRFQLVDLAFGFTWDGFERTVDTHVRNLRRKLEHDPANPAIVETVYGVGYRFAEAAQCA
jgi:DNA-binding response OmpR family regulator